MSNKVTCKDQVSDVRAEVLVAMLLRDKNIKADHVAVSNKGAHKRTFSNDIHKIDKSHSMSDDYRFLIQLNRDGVYDAIPEAFFHLQEQVENGYDQARFMSEQYKRHKSEEKEARDFFAPIENEIFLQRVGIENNEVKELYKLHQYDLSLPFFGLNSIDESMPAHLCRKWVALLPYISGITGDLEQIRQCAEFFLEEGVQFVKAPSKLTREETRNSRIGDCILGGDMLLGNCFDACFTHIELIVGPVSRSKAKHYTPNQTYARFIDIFLEVFTPMSIDFTWRVEVENTGDWILGEDEYRLNFTTTI